MAQFSQQIRGFLGRPEIRLLTAGRILPKLWPMNDPIRRGRPTRLDTPLRVRLPIEIKAALDAAARAVGEPTGPFAAAMLRSVGVSKDEFLAVYQNQKR